LAATRHDGRRLAGGLVVPGIAALALVGCATRGSVVRVRDDVTALRVEVTALRKSQEASSRDLARVIAEHKALESRLAEVSAAQRTSAAELAKLRERMDAMEATAQETKILASFPSPPPAAPSRPPTAPSAPPVAPPGRAAPALAPSPPPAAKEPPARGASAEHVYNLALATFRTGEHGQAVLDFLDFIAKYPRHPLVANAQYWIGEAY